MANVIRRRVITSAVKFETIQGVDAFAGGAASASADFFKSDVVVTFAPNIVQNPELTGTLEEAASIPGGTKVKIEFTCMAKGSGSAAVAPQWGKLMQLCSWQEQITAVAIAASAATAGTTNSATLGTGYSTTAEAYQGMPATLGVNPAGGLKTVISDYTAGKVATFAHTLAAALDTSTTVAIPAHVLYKPTSDTTVQKYATTIIYMDGVAWRFVGCQGNWTLDATGGGTAMLKFALSGVYASPVAATAPTGLVFDATEPPVWRQGIARLGGQLARASKASFDGGNVIFEPENPEAYEGFDIPVITRRAAKGSFDPLSSVTDTIARFAAFRAGNLVSAAIGLGTVPGNQIAVVSPTAKYTSMAQQNRSDLMADQVGFECPGPNASIFLAVY